MLERNIDPAHPQWESSLTPGLALCVGCRPASQTTLARAAVSLFLLLRLSMRVLCSSCPDPGPLTSARLLGGFGSPQLDAGAHPLALGGHHARLPMWTELGNM